MKKYIVTIEFDGTISKMMFASKNIQSLIAQIKNLEGCSEESIKNIELIERKENSNKEVAIVFYCDHNHTKESKVVMGVYENKEKAINKIELESHDSDEGEITLDDVYLLESINQTQGRAENYIIEIFEIE